MCRSFFNKRIRSFLHAFSGCKYILVTQKNAWIHTCATIFVLGLAAWLKINIMEWAILIIVIGFVWASEAINTSLESLVDLVNPQEHPLAKISKDVGAAAVLIASIIAVLVGLLIFGPLLINKIK